MRDAPSLTTRDSTLPRKARDRDGGCVITGYHPRICEATHIFPYSLGKSQARSTIDLWAVLPMFWGDGPTNELRDLIFGPPTGDSSADSTSKTFINKLYNIVTLAPHAHSLWAEGAFVLEPHPDDDSNDQHNLQAVFYWIHPHESTHSAPGIYPLININAPLPRIIPTLSQAPESGYMGLSNGRVYPPSPIEDGHIISFTTDDPITSPLPSRQLLNLQAALIRVLRMAGRAGWDVRWMNESEGDIDSIVNGDESQGRRLDGSSDTEPTTLWTNSSPSEPKPTATNLTDETQYRNKSHFLRHIISQVKTLFRGDNITTKLVRTRKGVH
ncbi:hypothetical protein GP486_007024 [Trichoglossum hirsutum]|uniref:HNH nuclease domain-containing protein n=1 Tax=Trichoglossum hirsutum TaxID=265104 RepID=A0A9P8L7P5_9PEZI|nr:hypothetical protein GP486_007024 [Trichoglossum hirsutum]